MLKWLLVACAGGCIDATFLPCGNDICPTSSICLDGVVCATQPEIDACTDLADAAPCHADLGDGYCTHGACVPNVCGDGQLTGIEQCDGDLVSISCADLGYYAGATSCSPLCTVDRSGCTGRCGDGIVQADQGEECDGAPPAFDCTDVGFDYGALTCAATCASNPTRSCSRFGWRKLGLVDYGGQVVGDAGMYAIMNFNAVEVYDTAVTTHPGTYVAIDALAGDVLAATKTSVERYHAGAWTALPDPPLPTGEAITEAKLADDGTAFVLASGGGCSIASFDGTRWTVTAGPASCVHLAAFAPGDFIVSTDDGNVHWQWPGCDPVNEVPCGCQRLYGIGGADADAFAIRRSGGNVLVYSAGISSGLLTTVVVPHCGGGPGDTPIATLRRDKFVLRDDDIFGENHASFGFSVERAAATRVESVPGPPSVTGEPADMWATRDGVLYVESDGSLFRLATLARDSRDAPGATPVFPDNSHISLAPDGTIAECDLHVSATTSGSGNGYQQLGTYACVNPIQCCSALYASSATAIYASLNGGLAMWDGGTWTTQVMLATMQPVGTVTSLAGNSTSAVGVTAGGVIGTATANKWIALAPTPAGCTINVVGMTANLTVYAGGGCTPGGGVIWRYDPGTTSWIELERDVSVTGYISMSVAGDGTVFAASGTRVVVGATTNWTAFDAPASVVAAVSATDAFATNAAVPTRVTHFDGTRWTPVNVDPTRYYFGIAASPIDMLVFGSQRISQPVPALEGFVRVP